MEPETYYITTTSEGSKSTKQKLSTLKADPTVELSVVVPCYNETKRLAIMLEESVPILTKLFGQSWEILIVDDGSKDGSAEYALQWAIDHKLGADRLRVCSLVKNRGKGGAVTHGMKFFRGKYAIFADADGASKFADVEKLLSATKGDGPRSVAIGSRAHMVKTDAVVKRSFIRNFLMYGLHTLVFLFGIRTIGDTQCGFKLFSRQAANDIFPFMHTEGWIFDVEVLLVAAKKDIPIHEIAISWHEVEGSKIDLAKDSIKMAIDLVVMRCAYVLGIYDERKYTQKHAAI